jgi:hypothetical protein
VKFVRKWSMGPTKFKVMLYCCTVVVTYRFKVGSVRTGLANSIVPFCTS